MSNIVSTILIVASVGIFWSYVSPTYGAVTGRAELKGRSIQELREESTRYLDALNKTKEIEQARTGLLKKYNDISAKNREDIEKLLPDHIDSVRLIIDVNNIASKYNMSLKNIGLSESDSGTASTPAAPVALPAPGGLEPPGMASLSIGPSSGAHFKATELRFGVTGSYEDFRAFLRNLEQSLRLVDVTSISFSAPGDAYDYTFAILTYRLDADNHEHF